MSDIIHLLPDSVANQIAAGEVIQRPASVIKELVENSIDAEATEVHVLVTEAGKNCIQVIDNGKGMSETDARLAFERHATSKITSASDLFALRTMGFRGEALASIAAVAEVELKSRQRDAELGTKLFIAGSKVESQETISCPIGSNFKVQNLFYNVPARRKFLKSNATELSNVMTEFERIALVHPDVSFYLYSNDAEVMNLPAAGLHQRIIRIFGKKLNQQLIAVNAETAIARISGYVGKPDSARKKGAQQYFFVNGRYMRHGYFHRAVMDAFENLIPTGEQVPYFIYFEVDPSQIDVNIHTTKTEIKFENEQAIWQILSAAIKESLGKFSAVPSIDFDTAGKPQMPIFSQNYTPVTPPKVYYNQSFNPFSQSAPSKKASSTEHWQELYAGLVPQKEVELPGAEPSEVCSAGHSADLINVESSFSGEFYQYKGRFIMTSVKSGLMIIDQHRAHINVLYEQYLSQIEGRQRISQGLLFPEVVTFQPSEVPILESVMNDLVYIGFDLTSLGGGSYSINGIPEGIEGLKPADLLRDMVNSAKETGSDIKHEIQSALALSMAKAVAIVYGQVLSGEEMADLVNRLFACSQPNFTPDGHVVVATLNDDVVERMF